MPENEIIKLGKETILNLIDESVVGDYILITALPVIDHGKYQDEIYIIMNMVTRKFYKYICTRSGSYFDEYNYEYGEDKENNVTLIRTYLRHGGF